MEKKWGKAFVQAIRHFLRLRLHYSKLSISWGPHYVIMAIQWDNRKENSKNEMVCCIVHSKMIIWQLTPENRIVNDLPMIYIKDHVIFSKLGDLTKPQITSRIKDGFLGWSSLL
jgi:hypothetical protein